MPEIQHPIIVGCAAFRVIVTYWGGTELEVKTESVTVTSMDQLMRQIGVMVEGIILESIQVYQDE